MGMCDRPSEWKLLCFNSVCILYIPLMVFMATICFSFCVDVNSAEYTIPNSPIIIMVINFK